MDGGGSHTNLHGVALLVPLFWMLASFSSCFFGLGLPGLLATFLLVFGYVSVGIYLQS